MKSVNYILGINNPWANMDTSGWIGLRKCCASTRIFKGVRGVWFNTGFSKTNGRLPLGSTEGVSGGDNMGNTTMASGYTCRCPEL